jgi:hypothetical protein
MAIMAAVFPKKFPWLRNSRAQLISERRKRLRLAVFSLACAVLSHCGTAQAQEALRASINGSEAAAARRQRITTVGYYNIKLGDTVWRFSAGVGMEYGDNVNLSQTNAVGDFSTSPSLNTSMLWPVSEKNALNLSLDVGYSFYANQSDLDRYFIQPGTELSFDIYVKDFSINLHDRPSLTQHAYQNPSVSGTGNYAQFENTAGVSVSWDLNKAVVNSGFDHNNYWSVNSSSQAQANNGSSDTFYTSIGAYFWPEIQIGLEGGTAIIQYSSTNSPNAFQWNAGTFVKYQTSEYLSFRASVGYTVYSPDQTGAFILLKDTTLIYLDLSMTHRLNQFVNYTLSASRGVNLSLFGQTYESYQAGLTLEWKLLRKIGLRTPFSYERGSEITGNGETFEQFQSGINLDRTLTEKLTAGLGYHVVFRNSQTAGRNYTANTVSLNFNYRF